METQTPRASRMPDRAHRPIAPRTWLRRPRSRGQALAEFALALPVLILILLMALDFGRVYLGWVNLNNAARIGANFAALHPDAWGDPGNADDRATYEALIENEAVAINCTLPSTLPAPSFPGGTTVGQQAVVDLTCDFGLLTPFLGAFISDPVPVGASAVFPIRAGTIVGLPIPSEPDPAPVADFSGTPTSGDDPLTVAFTDLSSNSPTSWNWDFGDFGWSTEQNPSHTYNNPGTYTVSLTVSNANGTDTRTRNAYISVSTPPPAAPTANFTASPTTGEAPLQVGFTDQSTGSPTSWSWTFGDGGTSTQQDPNHTYTQGGTYTVSLTVSNADGSNTLTRVGYIALDCVVPNFAGTRRNDAQTTWSAAGFTTAVLFLPGSGNYWINYQSLPGGLSNPPPDGCASTITVGP